MRKSRRECAMLDAAGDKEGFQKASALLKQRESALKNYCESTGRTYKSDRVQVSGFNRSVSAKATAANKSAERLKAQKNSGTIKVDSTITGHASAPIKGVPNSVMDHLNSKGKTETRSFYDDYGRKSKDVTNHNHNNPKTHPFGINGEHAHDYKYDKNGKLIERYTRELTTIERKENGDIL